MKALRVNFLVGILLPVFAFAATTVPKVNNNYSLETVSSTPRLYLAGNAGDSLLGKVIY